MVVRWRTTGVLFLVLFVLLVVALIALYASR